jgi:ADP-heptose:LPS heptosyltransferase
VAVKTLLVYRALGLGDLMTAVPALRALGRAFPEHHRVLAAPAALAPLVALIGAVDDVVDCAPLEPLPLSLHGADVAINLHGRGPQSTALLDAAQPRVLIAFGRPPRPLWDPHEHEVARWCRLLTASGIAADPHDLRITRPAVPAPPAARHATLIHPGAAGGARRWPPDRWAAVASAELARGRRVAITGSADERELAFAVATAAGVPEDAVLAGATDLVSLAATVAGADRLACGDTGIAHLATALGTPSVVLFGPTPPAEWGPPPGPRHIALWAGRRGDPHGAEPDPGLLRIMAPAVVSALARVGPRHGTTRQDHRTREEGGRRSRG